MSLVKTYSGTTVPSLVGFLILMSMTTPATNRPPSGPFAVGHTRGSSVGD